MAAENNPAQLGLGVKGKLKHSVYKADMELLEELWNCGIVQST